MEGKGTSGRFHQPQGHAASEHPPGAQPASTPPLTHCRLLPRVLGVRTGRPGQLPRGSESAQGAPRLPSLGCCCIPCRQGRGAWATSAVPVKHHQDICVEAGRVCAEGAPSGLSPAVGSMRCAWGTRGRKRLSLAPRTPSHGSTPHPGHPDTRWKSFP